MKKSRFSDEQVVKVLRAAEKGEETIGAVCLRHGITEQTFIGGVAALARWRHPT